MALQSRVQIKKFLDEISYADRLDFAYGLSKFAQLAIYPSNYQPSPRWAEIIILTEEGRNIFDQFPSLSASYSKVDLYFAMFGIFAFHNLLIDANKSDLDAVFAILNDELLRMEIRWPYQFGRMLYDRYNFQETPVGTDHIYSKTVAHLLSDTPQGVFQMSKLVSGPFGFQFSQEGRYIPPTLRIPLWHCSDPGCSKFHRVSFLPPDIGVVRAFTELNQKMGQSAPPSQWQVELNRFHRRYIPNASDGRPFVDLPVLIGDSIIGAERTALLAHALNSSVGQNLRSVISAPPRRKKQAEGSAQEVASKLSEAEQVQLLLLLSDDTLTRLIDECIFAREIEIPPNEVRIARSSVIGWDGDKRSQISSLGIRILRREPLNTLATMIWDAYSVSDNLDELDWKLHKRPEQPSRYALTDFIQTQSPGIAVQQIILSSRPTSVSISDSLGLSLDEQESREALVDKILWKLGFSPFRYDDQFALLRTRAEQFKDKLLQTNNIRTEADRETIRSAGVNLFVSVEGFLENFIAYNVWLLASDHLLTTKFVYEAKDAIAAVGKVLGLSIMSGGQSITWNRSGGNTLGTLLAYLSQSNKWIEGLSSKERLPLKRMQEDIPYYAKSLEHVFPLNHYELWADSDPKELSVYSYDFKTISTHLNKANLAYIRNGIDHQRNEQEFPSVQDMIACVTWLKAALDYADINRYIPKAFWLRSRTLNQYGCREDIFQDYLERQIVLRGPSMIIETPSLSFATPLLIAPGNLFGLPNSEIKLRVQDSSPYSEYWSNFPHRLVSINQKKSTAESTLAPAEISALEEA